MPHLDGILRSTFDSPIVAGANTPEPDVAYSVDSGGRERYMCPIWTAYIYLHLRCIMRGDKQKSPNFGDVFVSNAKSAPGTPILR